MAALPLPFPQGVALAGRRGVLELFASALGGLSCPVLDPFSASPDLTAHHIGSSTQEVGSVFSRIRSCSAVPGVAGHQDSLLLGLYRGLTDLLPSGSAGQVFPSGCVFVPTQLWKFGCFGGPYTSLSQPVIALATNTLSDSQWSWSSYSKLTRLCIGTSAGILLFQASSSKESPPASPANETQESEEDDDEEDDQKDPLKTGDPKDQLKSVLRILKKIVKTMPVTEVKEPFWIVKFLEENVGPTATSNLVYIFHLLKDKWDRFYLFILFGLFCSSLKISPMQGCRILKYYVLEQREGMQKVLAAYARNSQRNDEDESVTAVVFSMVNLESSELSQIQLFLRGEEGAALLSLLEEWAMSQPRVKEGIQLSEVLLLLRGQDSEAVLRLLQELARDLPKGKDLLPSQK